MSNWMNNAKSWLGLGSDPYEPVGPVGGALEDDYTDEFEDDEVVVTGGATVTPIQGRSRDWDDDDSGVRVLEADETVDEVEVSDNRGVVRPLPSTGQPQLVVPDHFNDVQQVGDTFRQSQPVILNLQGLDREVSRRIIDFSSGLCYGLDGSMERVAEQVFLLSPAGTHLSDEERQRLRDGDYGDA
jgi:cell division inhibitor SepF